jgi:tetratricopeptide (TPR) repeat protein
MQWLDPVAAKPSTEPGDAAFRRGDLEAAIAAYEQAAAGDPAGFTNWARLAEALLALGQPAKALAACDKGAAYRADPALHHVRGHALRTLGLPAKANAEFLRALALGPRLGPLKALLRSLAAEADGARLLEFCDSLEPRHRDTALARAYRAVALSLLDRRDEANRMVDLERHVVRMPFDPPGDVEAFNRALAAEILAEASGEETAINYSPSRGPAMATLLAFTRQAIEDYAGRLPELGLADVLPPVPASATLLTATTVLRGEGRNRQHIHPAGYISTVYHVSLPDAVRAAADHRGALLLGPCDEAAPGHLPCWGTRHIKPVEGWLTLFPSHLFHDVVPSQSGQPRVSVASDLSPIL